METGEKELLLRVLLLRIGEFQLVLLEKVDTFDLWEFVLPRMPVVKERTVRGILPPGFATCGSPGELGCALCSETGWLSCAHEY